MSRCAATTSFGPPPLPGRTPIALPSASMRTFFKSERGEPRAKVFCARLLLEGWRGYHDQRFVFGERVGVVGLQKIEALLDLRMRLDRCKRRPGIR